MRIDSERLRKVKEILEGNFEVTVSFNEEEDYGIDLQCTGVTAKGKEFFFEMEVKTISPTYGSIVDEDGNYGAFFTRKAARNNKWRWCSSASSQAEFWADSTPSPFLGDKPIHVLNAADKNGDMNNSKLHKLLSNKCGLCFLTKEWLIVYFPSKLKKSIAGYGWLFQEHTKELEDKSSKFEYKALIDLSKGDYIPIDVEDGDVDK